MPDIKVRVGQSDAIKVTSTGLQRSDIAFSVSGGTANVTELDVSGQSNLNSLNVTGITTFKSDTLGVTGIIIDGLNETLKVGTGISFTSNSIEVDGSANFKSLIVSGISTLNSSGGITTTGGDLFVGSNLFLSNDALIGRHLRVVGVSTYVGVATFQNNVFVDGTLTAGLIDGGSFWWQNQVPDKN